jgi:hypothetical protein
MGWVGWGREFNACLFFNFTMWAPNISFPGGSGQLDLIRRMVGWLTIPHWSKPILMIYDASGIKCYGSVNHIAGLIRPKNGRFPTNIEVRNGGPGNWILPAMGFYPLWSTCIEELLLVMSWSRRNAGSVGSLLGLMFGSYLFELLAVWSLME